MSKGKASISASGASMSKYDVEVEARLQALEKAVASLQAHSHEAPCVPEVSVDAETVAKLVDVVKAVSPKAALNMGL